MKLPIVPVTFAAMALIGFLAGFGSSNTQTSGLMAPTVKETNGSSYASGSPDSLDEFERLTPTTADLAQEIERASLHTSTLHRNHALLEVGSRLTNEDIRKIIDAGPYRYGPTRMIDQHYDFLQYKLFGVWAERDPKSAAEYAKSQQAQGVGDSFIRLVTDIWVAKDPVGSLPWAVDLESKASSRDLMNDGNFAMLMDIYGKVKGVDTLTLLNAAQAIVQKTNGGIPSRNVFHIIFESCTYRDFDTAKAFADGLTDPGLRGTALDILIDNRVGKDPRNIFHHLGELQEIQGLDRHRWEYLVYYTTKKMAEIDASLAFQFIQGMPEFDLRDTSLVGTAAMLTHHDPAAAQAIVDSIPIVDSHNLSQFYSEWGKSDPVAAIQHGLKRLEQFPTAGNVRSKFEEILRETVIKTYCKDGNAEAMAGYLSQKSDPRFADLLLEALAVWGYQDPVTATSWAESLPPGVNRDQALTGVAKAHERLRVEETANQLRSMGTLGDPGHPAAVEKFAGEIFPHHSYRALKWIETIPDPDERIRRLVAAWKQWANRSPVQVNRPRAEHWRGTSPFLGDKEKRALFLP